MGPTTLHAYVAAAEPEGGRTGMGVVFVDAHGRALRKIGRALPGVSRRSLAAFRGIIYTLWHSRRLGARRVVIHCADPDVVGQINGRDDVDEECVGPYLEVRALLHAYRVARIEPSPQAAGDLFWPRAAQSLADAALDRDVDETVEDLPLWSGVMEERSTA
ncbi:MAG TPA: reverse transcriptase-like protein [bacterium]|nr:reverse transcriptase-like protein [bacterium]